MAWKVKNEMPSGNGIAAIVIGASASAAKTPFRFSTTKFAYLKTAEPDGHLGSVRSARLDGLSREELIQAIETKIRSGLVFHLRFVRGTRDDDPAPENDALMFDVQVEFPDDTGKARRYLVAIKYTPASHSGKVVSFY